jgi:NitT/TauT family transport system ATP-binding protein
MTALENVIATRGFQQKGFSGYLFGKKYRQAKAEAIELMEQVGLGHAHDKYPSELSGGMRQRLAIAQALLGKPRILLLDEPFGALDPGIRADMHQLVLKLWREHKLTVFMVTHDLHEGFFLGTRLWVFDKLRVDPHAPNAYGANITYDLPVGKVHTSELQQIENDVYPSKAQLREAVLS